jgi:hypothetical protein
MCCVIRHTDSIPGMCDHQKLFALLEICRLATVGDLVEIGSWWGKKAFILAFLAELFDIGNLLCIDPWASDELVQNDEKGLVDSVNVDANEALRLFIVSLMPYSHGRVSYLRQISVNTKQHYYEQLTVDNRYFGRTSCAG